MQTLHRDARSHARAATRAIGYLEGDGVEKSLTLAELRTRALGILHHLQALGAQARATG